MNWTQVFIDENFSVIDFETSGLKEKNDHIIKIGLVEVKHGRRASPLTWVMNPNFPDPFHVSAEVTMLTGITDTEISTGADPKVLLPSFVDRIRWNKVWGHNLLKFDSVFIDEEFGRWCMIPPDRGTWFDTAAVFKAWQLTLPGMKWKQEPDVLSTLEDYETFYDWGISVLNKPIRGLYYNLPHCCEVLNVNTSDIKFHRAGGDCLATYRVRNELKKIILG